MSDFFWRYILVILAFTFCAALVAIPTWVILGPVIVHELGG